MRSVEYSIFFLNNAIYKKEGRNTNQKHQTVCEASLCPYDDQGLSHALWSWDELSLVCFLCFSCTMAAFVPQAVSSICCSGCGATINLHIDPFSY